MQSYLDFEKPVADLEGKIAELKSLSGDARAVTIDDEINGLTARADQALADIYRRLTPWQKTQVARHPDRPHAADYIGALIDEWTPLSGDRSFGDDAAIMANCDFVVTSDTSVAHLAGAMGRPCWVALKRQPEWRWGTDGDTTPWYPGMTLFRQAGFGDWNSVFAAMTAKLSAMPR